MFSLFIKRSPFLPRHLISLPRFFYTPHAPQIRDEATGYYQNPTEIARRLIKLISLHDCITSPNLIKLESTWHEIGLDELSYVEVMLAAEEEFFLEFPDEEVERFKNVGDVVEFVARSFYAK
jgi:NADH dehydrogenase (ubiquinone) 1 alpha/beta subcomplex 1